MDATEHAEASEGFTFECVIDGQNYPRHQLARLQYSRDLHVLHELKRVGAPIALRGDVLSHDDINRLVAEDASSVSVTTRTSYDPDGIRHLFKGQLAASEQFWREMNAASEGQPLQPCVAELTITGVSFDQFQKYVGNMAPFLLEYAQCNPDHFFVYPDEGSLRGVEIFGMYGGPTEVQLTPDPDVSVPIERDETIRCSSRGWQRCLMAQTRMLLPSISSSRSTMDW